MDLQSLGEALPAVVPFVATLGISYEEITPRSARLRLADRADLRNHIGSVHAGALFTLGESASGAVVVAALGDRLDVITPLVAEANVEFLRVVRGDVVAHAELDQEPSLLLERVEAEGAVRFPVQVQLSGADGRAASRMTVEWVLKRSAERAPEGGGR